jgi:hypothetical protein
VGWIPPHDQYDTIIDYKVFWDSGSSSDWFDLLTSTTAGQLEWTVSGLTFGVYYQFKVSAINAIEESDQSVSLLVIAATVPDAPT